MPDVTPRPKLAPKPKRRPPGRARPDEPLADRCEAQLAGCTGRATERHHLVLRSQGGGDEQTKDLCAPCHMTDEPTRNGESAAGARAAYERLRVLLTEHGYDPELAVEDEGYGIGISQPSGVKHPEHGEALSLVRTARGGSWTEYR